MNDADRSIARLAEDQRNVFTRQQALSAGLSSLGLQRRVAAGLLVAVGTKTYRFAGAELDWRGQLLSGLFDLGPAALVTGRSAAALHGLDGFTEGPVELLVPRSRRSRLAAGRVSSTLEIGPQDRVVVDGLRLTSATRTIVELAGRVSERELGNAIDSACRLGLTSPVFLRRRLHDLGRQGRPGVATFDRVMESAGVQSWLEREFEHLIRSAGLPMPQRQRVYRRDGRHVARVDFDFEPWPVVAEVGGRRGYLSADDRRRQEHRRNELQLIGKVVYFFTTEDVVETPLRPARATPLLGYVISTLHAALDAAA